MSAITNSTRKPAGRPPVLRDVADIPKVEAYYAKVGREIPAPSFGRGRPAKGESERRAALKSAVEKFNSRMR